MLVAGLAEDNQRDRRACQGPNEDRDISSAQIIHGQADQRAHAGANHRDHDPFAHCLIVTRRASDHEHAVAVGIKAVTSFHRVAIGGERQIGSRERAHQQQ